jgi:imidazolonepropionase-like amidohydrolase
MGTKLMRSSDLSIAKDPVLRGSMAAMKRAAALARKIAIQTDTGIVVVRDGKVVRISAAELREDKG